MDLQKRRTFIISFIYFAIIGVICYILFKRLIPMLMPFIMALAIAAALDPAVSYLGSRMKGGYRCAAAAVLLLFYGCLRELAVFLHPGTGQEASCFIRRSHGTRAVPVFHTSGSQLPWSQHPYLLAWNQSGACHGKCSRRPFFQPDQLWRLRPCWIPIPFGGYPGCRNRIVLPYRKLPPDRFIPHAPDSG